MKVVLRTSYYYYYYLNQNKKQEIAWITMPCGKQLEIK